MKLPPDVVEEVSQHAQCDTMSRPITPLLPIILFGWQLHQSYVVGDSYELEEFVVFHLLVMVGWNICCSIFICMLDPFF